MLRVEELLSHSSECSVVHHRNLWEDDEGTVHRIPQVRGANRGCHDAPVVCSWTASCSGGHPQADESRRVLDGVP